MNKRLYAYRQEFRKSRLGSIYAHIAIFVLFVPAGAVLAVVITDLLIKSSLYARILMGLVAFVIITCPIVTYTYLLQRKRIVHIDISENHLICRMCIGRKSIQEEMLLKAEEEKHFLWGEVYRIYYKDDGTVKSIYILEADLKNYVQYKQLISGIIGG